MTSTLEDELGKANKAAQIALEARKKDLNAEEADIAESRVRYESERLLDFYDELDDKKVVEEVAAMIIRFRTLERNVGEVTSAALQLSSLPLDDTTHIYRYNRMIDSIDSLEDDCERFEVQLSSLSSAVSSSVGRMPSLLSKLSALLGGYVENVACARSVVECCKENYRMGVGTLTLN
ncbi:hypothetical protein C8Q74DRAFT_1200959 [Fomes fomentarius]|nr:hypothetical protein C8Q74DRAFT_1200959 [Fomes fomentarius]